MTRKMGTIEQTQTIVNEFGSNTAVGVLRLRHLPPLEKVQGAFALLQKRHPLLQMKIAKVADEWCFETVLPCPPIPVSVVKEAVADDWVSLVQQALNSTAAVQAPLLKVLLLQLADEAETVDMIMVFNHAMMDAFSGIRLIEELLLLLSGEWTEPLQTMPLLPASEALFPATMQGVGRARRLAGFMLRQAADEISYRWQARNGRQQPIHETAVCIPLSRSLSVAETGALSRAVRQQGVTLNSAVAAAQLLAVHKHVYQQEAGPLRTMIFANLRPYLQPPVSPQNLGCYITPTRQTVSLPTAPDFWTIAKGIQRNITTAMRRGDGFMNSLLSKQLVQMIIKRQSERLATTAVSYVGPLQLRPQYGEIEVLDLHAFLANVRLGPEFTAFCQIFQGKLAWDFVYLDTDMAAETAVAIAAETCAILQRAAQ